MYSYSSTITGSLLSNLSPNSCPVFCQPYIYHQNHNIYYNLRTRYSWLRLEVLLSTYIPKTYSSRFPLSCFPHKKAYHDTGSDISRMPKGGILYLLGAVRRLNNLLSAIISLQPTDLHKTPLRSSLHPNMVDKPPISQSQWPIFKSPSAKSVANLIQSHPSQNCQPRRPALAAADQAAGDQRKKNAQSPDFGKPQLLSSPSSLLSFFSYWEDKNFCQWYCAIPVAWILAMNPRTASILRWRD